MDAKRIRNYFFYLTCLVVILAGLKAASEIVIILFLAIFIASIVSTIINFLEQKRIPKILSYLVVIGIFSLITLLLSYIVNISLKDFLTNLPQYEKQLQGLVVNTIALGESYGIEVDKKTIMEALSFSSFFWYHNKCNRKYWNISFKIFTAYYWYCFYTSRIKIF